MRRPRHFSEDETQRLLRLVLQVSVAVENAELYRQVHYVATLEERDRLSREMHDNLAQKLGYLNVQASIADAQLSSAEIGQARSSLQQLKQIAKEAYTDVREGIFSLRTTTAATWGLVPALQEYLTKYRRHYGLDVELVVHDGYHARFPADAEIQITRIVQEALMNVRKHSGADRAWVHLMEDDHHISVRIEDNGRGFDPLQQKSDGRAYFGLQIMRERAESIGAVLEIDSRKGEGTRVALDVPLSSEKWG
jgi:signal transduction histidine kinase